MADFKLTFSCKGPREPSIDGKGHPPYQLWRIENKYTVGRDFYYGAMYYEETARYVHPVPLSKLEKDYPEQVQEWEAKFGKRWMTKYGLKGNPWVSDVEDSPPDLTPPKRPASSCSVSSESKRLFDDTPQKAKQVDAKKPKKDVFDIPSDDEQDPFVTRVPVRASAAKSSRFIIPVGLMGPPPRPGAANTAGPSALDDDDIEDSPTRGPPGASKPQGTSALCSNPKKPVSLLSGNQIRDSSRSQMRTNPPFSITRLPTSGSGSMPSSAQMRPNVHQPIARFPVAGNPSSKLQVAIPPNTRSVATPSDAVLPKTTASRQRTATSRQSSSTGDSTTDEDASSDEEVLVRRRSDSSNLAKKISGLQVSAGSLCSSAAHISPAVTGTTRISPASVGQSDTGTRSDTDRDENEIEKNESGPDAPEVCTEESVDGPKHAMSDSEEEDAEETEYVRVVGKVSEAAFAESQRELEEEDDEEELQSTQGKLPDGTPVYEDYSGKLIKAHDDGLDSLVRVALDLDGMPCGRWVKKRQGSKACGYEELLFTLWLMMAGWDPLILKHLVHGNIPAQQKKIPELGMNLRELRNLPVGIRIPSIYMQYLVDSNGKSPPPKVLLKILDYVEVYTRGLDGKEPVSNVLATLVDSAFSTTTWGEATARQGQRRYIEGPSQAETCLAWTKAARERLEGLPIDEPLERPWAECGYATVPNERLDQHAKHNSSNYLMNLTEAICKAKFAMKYVISQFVVHQIVHHTHAMYGEILASRMALVYTSQGGGWCHFKAGVSHSGVEKADSQHFIRKQKELWKDTDFIQRRESEIKKIHERAELHQKFQDISAGQREAIAEIFSGAQLVGEKLTEVRKQNETLTAGIKQERDSQVAFLKFHSVLRKMEDIS